MRLSFDGDLKLISFAVKTVIFYQITVEIDQIHVLHKPIGAIFAVLEFISKSFFEELYQRYFFKLLFK